MILFFRSSSEEVFALETLRPLAFETIQKLVWLFNGATPEASGTLPGRYLGPRREMVTPWSTNAVEIIQNMGIDSVLRVETYTPVASAAAPYDPMLQSLYEGLDQEVFAASRLPEPIRLIDDPEDYSRREGLALSPEEVAYLKDVSRRLRRPLTDSEVYGFAQVNSEHCRHKIFNGVFVIDGREMPSSLFDWIRKTSRLHPGRILSAYTDNVAFVEGPTIEQFAPLAGDRPSFFAVKEIPTALSLKAETHNFPTTVEPFNGAATGTGGEIRDRLGGGRGAIPLAGTAVYMTAYPRTHGARPWEEALAPRPWLYRSPEQILIKASDGASDFANKYGQPLICGSLLTFEYAGGRYRYGYDKAIMLAGGVGYANRRDAFKDRSGTPGKVVVMGGDNYRIGMGGGAVSSVNTGVYAGDIELNAVQRANPEMQKRVANVLRSIAESEDNPILSLHDHGAGGHLNCLSELLEATGGRIDMEQLPVGDPTLSAREILGNESQERMGLLVRPQALERLVGTAERERAPLYPAGETTRDKRLVFALPGGEKPVDLPLEDLLGKTPRTVMEDVAVAESFPPLRYEAALLAHYLEQVLQLEAVACKDWLTAKIDRSVGGKVARQPCQGELQLPLSDLGAVALDYRGRAGMATSIGHAPQAALIDPAAGSVLAIAEALTNLVFAPLAYGLEGVSLSANWMWPCRNEGEDARLYAAVRAASDFAISLGVNIPTGKDSLSMTQNYPKEKILSPGTVIISAGAEVRDVRGIVSPVVHRDASSPLYYIDFSSDRLKLGGSALAQVMNSLGDEAPGVCRADYFRLAFRTVQEAIADDLVLAGHDISAGGLITALLEMCFANTTGGLTVNLDGIDEKDEMKILFAENPGVLLQVKDPAAFERRLQEAALRFVLIARPSNERCLVVSRGGASHRFEIDALREVWYASSYRLDVLQSGPHCAAQRLKNYKRQPVTYTFPKTFTGQLSAYGLSPLQGPPSGVKAAILRDKGTNGEREMAYALHLAGFEVKDVHLTDLSSGRETLEAVNFIVFCGGFSNSDVLGPGKGWAAGILYNEKAGRSLERFYARKDTLSLGICNGCQLMAELDLLYPEHPLKHKMLPNESHKFESGFVTLEIPDNSSVMLSSLSGTRLGIWVAHGQGRFSLPLEESAYHVTARYHYAGYPANPNGSPQGVAGICSADGRHLAMMPHPERAVFPWQCGFYPHERKNDEVTPWIEAFVNARKWIEIH
ncbi:MAG: phosphoribosylformylglycinamidine synthase [Tannerellaceae bacterium]|jgi:phosphoribosylformylglycinamidine synthase|nr:phosphoribosylformylglycinamidine synthase [Tannerellaceae bacterium]